MSFVERPLPVERVVFASDALRIGAFRCSSSDPLFRDSGAIDNHIFVFPRSVVVIEHENASPFVADSALATLYNRGQRYRRHAVGESSDDCDWFALAPDLIEDAANRGTLGASGSEGPFASAWAPVDARTYARQRRLFTMAAAGHLDAETATEEAMDILCELMRSEGTPRISSIERRLASETRALVASRHAYRDSLRQIAADAGASPFHLCRTFRKAYGYSIGEYRERIRLNVALGRLAESEDLTALALDLGFASHAHFTSRFRRAFGSAPSLVRRELRR